MAKNIAFRGGKENKETLSPAEIRDIIRTELALFEKKLVQVAVQTSHGDSGNDIENSEMMKDDNISDDHCAHSEAFEKSIMLIEESGLSQVWDEDMRDQFQKLLEEAAPNERQEMALALARAVNNGEIKIDVQGPLY